MNKALFNELEKIGRIQLSEHFFMREFLYSEISIANNISNLPDNLAIAVEAGTQLCEQVLEPIQKAWGRLYIRSGYRSSKVNEFGNKNNMNCASNASNFGAHIWDIADNEGFIGASACVVIPKFLPYFQKAGDWPSLAWWLHENIPNYTDICFFNNNAAFNIRWSQNISAKQNIKSFLINPDTGSKEAIVKKGKIHQKYVNIIPSKRFEKIIHLIK
ncbi:peptidase M15 [Litorilituus lipolyticus]|uniref:Peptidase M15 n=1 Tax=Litorilituus lipolyticus TaxID=2491017 RepID=A0A502KV81_9GAMM|nr:peptidase M15 [Litorilituus lipolyticus]TPH13941.1 peptidase M15 [Litorilituus lipolyticus]